MHHDLKTQPDSFKLLSLRKSEVQLRKNDRDFNIDDTCSFYEWEPRHGIYTGHAITNVKIIDILKEHEGLAFQWCLIVLDLPKTNIVGYRVELAGKNELPKEEVNGKQTE